VFLLANPQGVYDDDHTGTIITGPDGAYRFESNFPGNYEGSPAPHIHLLVSAPGHRAIETEYLPRAGQTSGTFDVTLAPE
jgi:protocatechuate 3,4-dioxygenase beta subunit